MKNSIEILNPAIKSFSYLKTNEFDYYSNKAVSNLLIDAFNNQTLLNSQFKKKISGMINLIEFSYSDDRVRLNNTIDSFLDLSHKSLVNYIQIDLDSNLNTKNVDLNYCDFSPFDKNDYWMEDWMEQTCSFKEARNNMLLQEHHSDDFCYYVEAID